MPYHCARCDITRSTPRLGDACRQGLPGPTPTAVAALPHRRLNVSVAVSFQFRVGGEPCDVLQRPLSLHCAFAPALLLHAGKKRLSATACRRSCSMRWPGSNRASIQLPSTTSHPTSTGTYDIGLMQINSSHLPGLAGAASRKRISTIHAPTSMWVPGSLRMSSRVMA